MGLICCTQDCECCNGPFSPQSILKITWEIEGPEPDPENCHCTEGWKEGVWYACKDENWTTAVSGELLNPCATGLASTEGSPKWEGEVRLADCDLDGKIRVHKKCETEEWYAELVRFDPNASDEEQHKKIWAVCLDESHGAHKDCKGVDATEDNVLDHNEWFSDLDCNDSSDNKLNLKIEVAMNRCCLDCKECCFHPDTELEFEWEGENCFDEDLPELTPPTYGKLVIPKTEMKFCDECYCDLDADLTWVSKGPVTIERVLSGTCGATASEEIGKYIFVKSACKSVGGHMWEFQIRDNLEICPPATPGDPPNEAPTNECAGAYTADSVWKRVADEDLEYTEGCDGVVMDDSSERCVTDPLPATGRGLKTIKATLTVLKNSCCKDLNASDPGACASDVAFCPCFVRNAMIPATNDCDLYP